MAKCLYITYDGLTDPLGQAQVLPYLEQLSALGYRIHVLSFEKAERRDRVDSVRLALDRAEIRWHPLRYTKRPPVLSTVWDLARMHAAAARLHTREAFDLIHCRSYLPALVGMRLKRRTGVPFIFDMRGFWPDEKVDAGAWPLSNRAYAAVYRFFKGREVALLASADAIVMLTDAGMRVLQRQLTDSAAAEENRRVIPCSVDFDQFAVPTEGMRKAAREAMGLPADALVLTYLGSTGTWYLVDEMLDFFSAVHSRFDTARLLFITPDSPDAVWGPVGRKGIDPALVTVRAASRDEVPGLLAATDVGLFFIRATPSKLSSSPTKLAELLAMGLPVITGPGIGDVEDHLARTGGGLVLEGYSAEAYRKAAGQLDRLLAAPSRDIRQRASEIYDLRLAVETYRQLYEAMIDRGPRSDA